MKQAQVVVGIVVLWVVAWGLGVVLLDTQPSGSDNIFPLAYRLYELIPGASWSAYYDWARWIEIHPPLPYIYSTLVGLLVGFNMSMIRLSCVLLHAVAVMQVYHLARTVRCRETAVIASVLAAGLPMMSGWFRLEYQEPVLTVVVLATLQLAHRADLERLRSAIPLGAVLGLGALAKVSYGVFVFPAAMIFLGARVRSIRAAAGAGAALVTALVVSGWWYWQARELFADYSSASTGQLGNLLSKASVYFWSAPGNITITVAAVAGIVLVLRRGKVPLDLWLMMATWAVGYLLFLVVFDVWGRYILPLLPLSCVLAAIAVKHVLDAFPGERWARLGWLAFGLAVAVPAVVFNLAGDGLVHRGVAGLQSPDRRDHGAFQRAFAQIARTPGAGFVLVYDRCVGAETVDSLWTQERLRHARPPEPLTERQASELLARGGPAYALLVSGEKHHSCQGWINEWRATFRWLNGQPRRVVGRHRDASPFRFTVYRLGRRDPP